MIIFRFALATLEVVNHHEHETQVVLGLYRNFASFHKYNVYRYVVVILTGVVICVNAHHEVVVPAAANVVVFDIPDSYDLRKWFRLPGQYFDSKLCFVRASSKKIFQELQVSEKFQLDSSDVTEIASQIRKVENTPRHDCNDFDDDLDDEIYPEFDELALAMISNSVAFVIELLFGIIHAGFTNALRRCVLVLNDVYEFCKETTFEAERQVKTCIAAILHVAKLPFVILNGVHAAFVKFVEAITLHVQFPIRGVLFLVRCLGSIIFSVVTLPLLFWSFCFKTCVRNFAQGIHEAMQVFDWSVRCTISFVQFAFFAGILITSVVYVIAVASNGVSSVNK